MNTILALVESQQQFEFFVRFIPNARILGYHCIFITSKWSVWYFCKLRGIECSLIKRSDIVIKNIDLTTTGEVVHGFFTTEEAAIYYSSFVDRIKEIYHHNKISLVMIWGGGDTVASQAILDQTKGKNTPTLFFDKANIPRKVFVDPLGANFKSYLYKNINILDELKPNDEAFKKYKDFFQSTGQSLKYQIRNRLNWLFPFDLFYAHLKRIPFRGEDKIKNKILRLFLKKRVVPENSYDLNEGAYIFIPLNHSFEIQKENMNYSLAEEQIAEGRRIADESGKDIILKFHPAENDTRFVDFVSSLQFKYRFIIRNNSSRELISFAYLIIASNTSVALEAMLMDKPVKHVGNSLFRQLDQKRLSNYVTWYLVDIDLSSNEQISTEILNNIYSRAALV